MATVATTTAPITEIKNNPLYWEKDPEKKTYEWAHGIVSMMRGEWKSIINAQDAREGREILLSKQNIDKIQRGFKKSSDFVKNTDWVAIGVMDRIRNIIIAEFLKAAYTPQVEAIDVAADNQKKVDRQLLAGRANIEQVMTDLNKRTGDPMYKVPYNKFNGNIEKFDQMGLDDLNEEDLNFFFETFHRLWHEANAEELLRALMKHNKFENHVESLVNDILATNCISYQVYASPFTGEIKWKYISPDNMKAIEGIEPDFSDAVTLGFQQRVSVRQFLDLAGPEFDWSRDRYALAKAINSTNGTDYEWVQRDGCYKNIIVEAAHPGEATTVRPVRVASSSQMLRHSVDVGYMEWKSVDRVVQKYDAVAELFYPLTEEDRNKNFPEGGRFSKDIREFQKTYKTWFLATGGMGAQLIFRFGPLYHMLSHGEADEFSSYSLSAYRGKGKPATQIVKPFVDIANKAFYKMLWAIEESTPRIRVLHYDSIAQLILKLKPKGGQGGQMGLPGGQGGGQWNITGQINQILEHYRNSLTQLYATPEVEGQKFGGNGRPHYWDEGGIDPLAPAMQTVMDWAEAQVSARLGINPARDAYSTDPKDGYRLQMQQMQQSRNATYYIPFMIQNLVKNVGTATLNIAQDAIEMETEVYSWLTNLIGEDNIESFKALDKVPMHSYGIYVELFNAEDRRAELKQDAQLAFSRQEIRWDEYLMVKEMDDYKKAALILAFYRHRNEKIAMQNLQMQRDQQIQFENLQTQNKLLVIDRQGDWDVKRTNAQGEYYMRAHQTPADASIQKKQMDIESNRQKLDEKADATIKVKEAENSLRNSAPIPPGTGPLNPNPPANNVRQPLQAGNAQGVDQLPANGLAGQVG